LKSLESTCVIHQVLLSHKYYGLQITQAPNPYDILWQNIHVPLKVFQLRRYLADMLILMGILFWAVVVTAVTTFSNLDSLAETWAWLGRQKNTSTYILVNDYLPFLVILILMALLPLIFDLLARYYERVKCESEIQLSIMNRFFYYQLANVYVSITAGSVTYSINEIINNPQTILLIIGQQLPSVSIYFAGLITVRVMSQYIYFFILSQ